MILTDSRGSVLDFKSLNETQIISKDGTFSIALPEVEEPIMEVPHQESMTEVKITMNEDNSVILGKDWKIDIDFKNFKVNLTGGEISNLRPKEVKNTKIDVFLTKENQDIITKDFSGLRIASANLERSLEGHTKMIDTNVTTDLLQIPPQGTYYILLTLSIIDDEGNWSVKNKRAFTETITL